jgi:putative ABC transport system permease protein
MKWYRRSRREDDLDAAAGAVLGLALNIPVFRVMAAGLSGLGAISPWVMLVAPAVLLSVAASACCIPALTASRVDPYLALRCE